MERSRYKSYDALNITILTWGGNQVKYHTTHNYLEYHKDADNAIINNSIRSVSGIIHTIIGITFLWKLQIQPAVASESTDVEIKYMYKVVNIIKAIRR